MKKQKTKKTKGFFQTVNNTIEEAMRLLKYVFKGVPSKSSKEKTSTTSILLTYERSHQDPHTHETRYNSSVHTTNAAVMRDKFSNQPWNSFDNIFILNSWSSTIMAMAIVIATVIFLAVTTLLLIRYCVRTSTKLTGVDDYSKPQEHTHWRPSVDSTTSTAPG